jgi:hypothetical protein
VTAPPLHLAGLLVRARLRSLWNGAFRVPQRRSWRLAWLFLLATPVAYAFLFVTAFEVIVQAAPPAVAAAALAAVCGAIALASLAAKIASTEAIIAGSAENEFLMARPVSLPALVVARSLAGAATDFFDALFLLPALAAAAVVWHLGATGIAVAALTSVIVQIGISALAQLAQVAAVRLVRPARRRLLWTCLMLLSALSMAALWAVATTALRSPRALVMALVPLADGLRASPAGAVVAPLFALKEAGLGAALAALAMLAAATGAALALAWVGAARAGRHGWEQAGAPWAEAARQPSSAAATSGPFTPFGKDLRLVLRDRPRLLSLFAVPTIFIGVQIFGGAGWGPGRSSIGTTSALAFSLAAYMATFGPLGHMEAERRAFWILRSVPVSLQRLFAWKAAFWSVIVGGTAALAFAVLVALSRAPVTASVVASGALATGGAVLVSWLAVGLAAGAADLFDDGRSAIGAGTVYLFLLVAGLFNVVLAETGETRARGLLLYVLAVALLWGSGIERAAGAFDPESRVRRTVSAGDGAVLAILLFVGRRALATGAALAGQPEAELAGGLLWAAIIAVAAAVYLQRRWQGSRRRHLLGLLAVVAIFVATMAVGATGTVPLPWLFLAVVVVAEELCARGIVQRALEERWGRGLGGRAAAFAVAALLAAACSAASWSPRLIVVVVVVGAVRALAGRLWPALAARALLEVVLVSG